MILARAFFLLWLLKPISWELVKEEYPLSNRIIAKKSTAYCQDLQHTSGNAYQVTGDLTLLGRTKPVTFDVEYSARSTGLDARASLTARTTLNRDDFGLGRGILLQSAADKMATVEIALVAVRKEVETPEAKAKVG